MDSSLKEIDGEQHARSNSDVASDLEKQSQAQEENQQDAETEHKEDGGPLERVDTQYPSFAKQILITICLCLATFLIALDRTIVATAIPQITDDFKSIQDIGWYGSVYLLTFCAFQLIFGRIYTFYSVKWVYLGLIGFFEVGSIVCAAAPNSPAFIVGRALTGLGASGIFSGAIVILVDAIPLEKRPAFQGAFSATFGVASVAGPLLGGAFTTDVTWRWCFWINLPIGGVVMVLLWWLLTAPKPVKAGTPLREQIEQLDPIGTLVFLPGVVCLLLALQWGGSTYPWSSGRIVALLVLAGFLLISFVGVQFWKKDNGTVPPRILKQRSILAGFFYMFFTASVMMILIYYIPIYFQAIKGATAVKSGIMNLPMLLSLVIASIAGGVLVTKIGQYVPFMIAGSILQAVGAGMITTWGVNTAHPAWIGYQVLYGLGLGLGMMQPMIAAQTVLEKIDVPTGISVMFFGQTLGGAVFISVGQSLLTNGLVRNLKSIPNLDVGRIVKVGATDLRRLAPPKLLPLILDAYNSALKDVWYLGAAMAASTIIPALFMQWKSVKGKKMH